jgi:hypothetical protein
LKRARRVVVFARYIGFARITRRLEIVIRRRLRDRLGPSQPVFGPRKQFAPVPLSAGWRFTFLNQPVLNQPVDIVGPGIDWPAPSPGAAHQLWRMNLHYMEYGMRQRWSVGRDGVGRDRGQPRWEAAPGRTSGTAMLCQSEWWYGYNSWHAEPADFRPTSWSKPVRWSNLSFLSATSRPTSVVTISRR